MHGHDAMARHRGSLVIPGRIIFLGRTRCFHLSHDEWHRIISATKRVAGQIDETVHHEVVWKGFEEQFEQISQGFIHALSGQHPL
jgi:hypothetical protein